jgi:hypothetical protein
MQDVHVKLNPELLCQKQHLKKQQPYFARKLDMNLRKKLAKCCIWNTASYGAETWDIMERRLEIPGNDREDRLDRSCEKLGGVT